MHCMHHTASARDRRCDTLCVLDPCDQRLFTEDVKARVERTFN